MRTSWLSWSGLALTVLICFVNASPLDDAEVEVSEPEITVIATFPEDNPFGQVVNGERNRINLFVENNSEVNVTLLTISGAFHDSSSDVLLKNTTSLNYGLPLVQGTKLQIPYHVNAEFKPGDVRLAIWLTHSVDDKVYRVTAYDSVVTVVEPEVSIFDYQVFTTYLITAAFVGGVGYFAFLTFAPKAKKSRKPVTASGGKQAISSPVGAVTASGVSGYEEEWIPEHHLKRNKSSKKAAGVLSSGGEELSGGETSGAEGAKRKNRR